MLEEEEKMQERALRWRRKKKLPPTILEKSEKVLEVFRARKSDVKI
jgi:hypothetical protein